MNKKYAKIFQKLATQIAKNEGKKIQVSISNIREILRVLVDLEVKSITQGPWNRKTVLAHLWNRADDLVQKARAKASKKAQKKHGVK